MFSSVSRYTPEPAQETVICWNAHILRVFVSSRDLEEIQKRSRDQGEQLTPRTAVWAQRLSVPIATRSKGTALWEVG